MSGGKGANGMDASGNLKTIPASPELSRQEVLRYSRHVVIPEVGMEGQRKLKGARVAMIGAGGLGSPLGLYLAAAGVGTLGVVDFDVVDESNLQRQVLHGSSDVGRPKLDSAADRLREVNPFVALEPHPVRLSSENALEILGAYDLVVDGTDNFPTRYLVNDACVLLGKPYVYGSIFRFEGQVSVFAAEGGPCYRCLFRQPPPPGMVPSCAEGGVLGVLPGLIGSAQAMEAIKLILGIGRPLVGRLAIFDGLEFEWREVRIRRDPECPVCGDAPTVTGLIDYEEFCGIPRSRPAQEREMDDVPELTATELKARLEQGERITLLDVREPYEWEIGNLAPEGATLIPLAELPRRLGELDPAAETVVYCRSGARSARAVQQLRAAGFTGVWNLAGGILAWSDEVDPDMPKY
jgi:sulfur-carrier protein adenylyltransferase/sulfurtransferase